MIVPADSPFLPSASPRREIRRASRALATRGLDQLAMLGARVLLLGQVPRPGSTLASALARGGYDESAWLAESSVPAFLRRLDVLTGCELVLVDLDALVATGASLETLATIALRVRGRAPLLVRGDDWGLLARAPLYGGDLFVPSEAHVPDTLGCLWDAQALHGVYEKERRGILVERAPTERVLIVDDEDLLLDVERALLHHASYATVGAGDGPEGLRLLKSGPGSYDLVWGNYLVRRLEGPGMLERARSIHGDMVPCVLYSGALDADAARSAWYRGAWAWMRPQDFGPARMLDLVQRGLDLRRARLDARLPSRRSRR